MYVKQAVRLGNFGTLKCKIGILTKNKKLKKMPYCLITLCHCLERGKEPNRQKVSGVE